MEFAKAILLRMLKSKFPIEEYFNNWQIDRLFLVFKRAMGGQLDDVKNAFRIHDRYDLVFIYARSLNPNIQPLNKYLDSKYNLLYQKDAAKYIHKVLFS